ncbi:hypothetical protein OKW21_001331 [Catalinimonas alkaloidigena]|uniref:hypothetical protein n=1 Tax=Catalinimonas alkaloidigena TaxID=1075417 RepID=UPI0024060A71|nr:hypothetical protein [Catalinimonas alkaloidigena]MDF9796068.1 hypothetical protein [Catalinimonas alkaloidigena]
MDTKVKDIQKKLEALWKEHEANAITDDDGEYVRLKGVNLSDQGLDIQDTRTPGNQSLSPTSDTQYDNYFLRGSGNDIRLFRNRDYKRNV